MTQPTTARSGKLRVLIGNGATPEVFTAPCGFTSKALNRGKNLSEVDIPDCDDPDVAYFIARDVQSKTSSITGEGLMAAESVPMWEEFYSDDESSRNCRVEIEFSTGMLVVTGAFHLETLNQGAERGGRVTANISLQSDGAFASQWIAA